jgi:hypothetical protein
MSIILFILVIYQGSGPQRSHHDYKNLVMECCTLNYKPNRDTIILYEQLYEQFHDHHFY